MKPRIDIWIVSGLVALLVGGCATAPVSVPPDERPGPLPPPLEQHDGAAQTPDAQVYAVTSGSIGSAYGCTVEYEYYEPARADPARAAAAATGVEPGLVVLGHGFMRDLASTRGWAKTWAARGVRTAVVSFCNSSWFSGRHERNADDLLAVAGLIAPGTVPVVYAGFSAGGLSALLAAAADPRAVGYLGLDPVDSSELASSADSLRLPALYLYGDPSSCNAENNLIAVMPPGGRRIALQIPYATHCDFENPTDPACSRFCGSVEPRVETEVRRTIRALATAWVEAQVGASASAIEVFHARTIDSLVDSGRVRIIANE